MTGFADEPKIKAQLVTTEADYVFLRELAAESSVTQGFVMHVLFEMLQTMVGTANESRLIDPNAKVSALESFVLLSLYHSGLLTDNDLRRAVMVAHAANEVDSGARMLNVRLGGLSQLANERLDEMRAIWRQRQPDPGKASDWDAAKAVARAMKDADRRARLDALIEGNEEFTAAHQAKTTPAVTHADA